jgi:uncharacterized protein (DUF983 family)
VRNGLRHRCPACGAGSLFSSYLKVAAECDRCAEALHHQRADDGPAYLTILIVGHIIGFLLHPITSGTDLSPGLVALILCGLAVPLSLVLLPRTKGLMVAIQWAKRMHGFGNERRRSAVGS